MDGKCNFTLSPMLYLNAKFLSFSFRNKESTTTAFFFVHYLVNFTLYYLFIHTLSNDDPLLSPIVIYCWTHSTLWLTRRMVNSRIRDGSVRNSNETKQRATFVAVAGLWWFNETFKAVDFFHWGTKFHMHTSIVVVVVRECVCEWVRE